MGVSGLSDECQVHSWCGFSSVVEHRLPNPSVGGSIPSGRASGVTLGLGPASIHTRAGYGLGADREFDSRGSGLGISENIHKPSSLT